MTDAPPAAAPPPATPAHHARHPGLATLALLLGTVAIGTTEWASMGLLTDIAAGIHASIPASGHAISAYAVGVVVGAPVVAALTARSPRRAVLIALMALFAVGNLASAFAGDLPQLMAARFLAGIPHGAFFGLASIVAVDIADPARAGRQVGRVMLGIPVANIAGVPAVTWLGQHVGWRSAFVVVAAMGLLTIVLVLATIPWIPGDPSADLRSELAAFHSNAVWLNLLIGAIGFGGMFALVTFIGPVLQHVTGLGPGAVPVAMLVLGLGGFAGTAAAGRLVGRSVTRTLAAGIVGTGVMLVVFAAVASWAVPAMVAIFLVSFATGLLVVALQIRLMAVAGTARTLGAASNHAALNLANALGAWVGGLVLDAGWGWRAPSLVGAGLSTLGLVAFLASLREPAPSPIRNCARN